MTGNEVKDIVEYLEQNAKRFPDRVALAWGSQRLTYRELHQKVVNLAGRFAELQLHGRRLGIFAQTTPELAIVYYAGFMSGTTVVPINYSFTSHEFAVVVTNCNLDCLIVDASLSKEACKAVDVLRDIPHKYLIGETVACEGFQPFESIDSLAPAAFHKSPSLPAVIFHTSGTTGSPKGVVHTLRSASYFAYRYLTLCGSDPAPVTLIARNCYHSGGFFHLTGALSAGTTCILADDPSGFDAEDFVANLEANKVTQIFLSVSMLNALLTTESISSRAFAHARFISAGADEVRSYHRNELRKYTDMPLTVRYSSTEATCVSIGDGTDTSANEISVGSPFAEFDWKIESDPTDSTGVGELLLKGEPVFQEYHNNPKANAACFTEDQWYRTGDLFKVDATRRLTFWGRKHNSMKVGGKFVYPEEIEIVANQYPAFEETVAVGVTHPVQVQVPHLFARLRPRESSFDRGIFLQFMQEHLAHYKIPTHVTILDRFPLTVEGKIDRGRLAAMTDK